MTDLIMEVLPFAVGVFASPLPVITGIVLLFTPRPRATSVTYVVTWVAGLTAATVVMSVLAGSIEAREGGGWGGVASGSAGAGAGVHRRSHVVRQG